MANGNVLASICVALICTGNAFAQSNNKHEHEGFSNIKIYVQDKKLNK